MVGFKLRSLVGGERQVEKYCCRHQMKNGGGFPQRTTVADGEQQH